MAAQDIQAKPGLTFGQDNPMSRELILVLALMLSATFTMILNETVMSVALPTLMVDFQISAAVGQWLTTAFLLTMAVVIPLTGLILQRFSTRAVFVASVGLFAAGTALSGFAPGFGLLVAGRVVQAAGTAIMLPLLTTTVLTLVPVSRRGRTMGLMSIVIAVAPAVGPAYSGFVLNTLSWRWTFLTILPIAVIVLILGTAFVKDFSARSAARFDILSAVLSGVAFGGLIYGLSSIGESVEGDALIPPWIPIAAGAVALVLFVLRQVVLQGTDAVLLDMRPFKERTFSIGTIMLMISMSALFGTLILLPLFMQQILALDTLQTGLMLLPGGLMMGLIAPFVGRAFDRWGPRPLIIPGSIIVALALGGMCLLNPMSPLAQIVATHIVLSLGLGMILTPLLTSTLGALRTELYSHGSAITNTLQQLAGAAGTTLFISVMTATTAASEHAGANSAAAQAEGIHHAFLWGFFLAIVAAGLSFAVRSSAHNVVTAAALH